MSELCGQGLAWGTGGAVKELQCTPVLEATRERKPPVHGLAACQRAPQRRSSLLRGTNEGRWGWPLPLPLSSGCQPGGILVVEKETQTSPRKAPEGPSDAQAHTRARVCVGPASGALGRQAAEAQADFCCC